MIHFLIMVYRATPRVQAHKADVRRRILVSARELVAAGGFAAATIATVASRAELATGTVYRYFPSKAQLLAEVFAAASGKEVEVMRRTADAPGSPTVRVAASIRVWAHRAIAGRTLAYALIAEPVAPQIESERLLYRRAYAEVLAGLVAQGAETGEFVVASVEVAAAALVGALAEALVGPLAPDDDRLVTGADATVDALVDFCLRSLGANP